jgi:hypothetical protein
MAASFFAVCFLGKDMIHHAAALGCRKHFAEVG